MDKYIGSEKLGIAHFPSLSKPSCRFFTITTGIKGTVAYFAFTHLLFFVSFYRFFQKHSIYEWHRFNLFKIKVIQTQIDFCSMPAHYNNKHVMIANSTRNTTNTYSLAFRFYSFTPILVLKRLTG